MDQCKCKVNIMWVWNEGKNTVNYSKQIFYFLIEDKILFLTTVFCTSAVHNFLFKAWHLRKRIFFSLKNVYVSLPVWTFFNGVFSWASVVQDTNRKLKICNLIIPTAVTRWPKLQKYKLAEGQVAQEPHFLSCFRNLFYILGMFVCIFIRSSCFLY